MPDSHGIFSPKERRGYLSKAVVAEIEAFHKAHCPLLPIVDFGCGDGGYLRELSRLGVQVFGIEGCTKGLSEVFEHDLCEPLRFMPNEPRLSVCLEVAEHIPNQFESVFLDNISYEAPHIALSWAVRGQGGNGHVNCRNSEEVVAIMDDRGYVAHDWSGSRKRIREAREKCPWFANTFMLFSKHDIQDHSQNKS